MTEHRFKNGIVISIPDTIPKESVFSEWTNVTMYMSIILNPPPVAAIKERKPYDMASWTEKRKKQTVRAVKAFHRMKKKKLVE